MIGMLFMRGNEIVEVRLNGNTVTFRNENSNNQFVTIEHLRLDYQGAILEHPDLAGSSEWRKKTIERFKKFIQALPDEKAKINYLRLELEKHGYIPYAVQKEGHRIKKL